jgi:hypothetical protein
MRRTPSDSPQTPGGPPEIRNEIGGQGTHFHFMK